MRCSKCHCNQTILNKQHYYYPQQLKEFLQEKVSHLKQTPREDCNEHYHFTQVHGCKQT